MSFAIRQRNLSISLNGMLARLQGGFDLLSHYTENLAHDFPQRIRYWLDGKAQLHARVEDKDGKKGADFTWQKSAL